MDQEVAFGGQTMKSKTTIRTEFAFSVVSLNGENLIIDAIINRSDLEVKGDQGNITASSTDATETQYNKELKAYTGKVVRAEVTPYFELVGNLKLWMRAYLLRQQRRYLKLFRAHSPAYIPNKP